MIKKYIKEKTENKNIQQQPKNSRKANGPAGWQRWRLRSVCTEKGLWVLGLWMSIRCLDGQRQVWKPRSEQVRHMIGVHSGEDWMGIGRGEGRGGRKRKRRERGGRGEVSCWPFTHSHCGTLITFSVLHKWTLFSLFFRWRRWCSER